MLVLYSAWASPFELALERAATTPLLVADLVADAFFAVDIAASFSVAYFDRSANLFVDDRRKIAARCLTRPWFAMDVASTVPFHIIYRLVSGRSTGFRYLNLLRLWRLRRVSKLFARYPGPRPSIDPMNYHQCSMKHTALKHSEADTFV